MHVALFLVSPALPLPLLHAVFSVPQMQPSREPGPGAVQFTATGSAAGCPMQCHPSLPPPGGRARTRSSSGGGPRGAAAPPQQPHAAQPAARAAARRRPRLPAARTLDGTQPTQRRCEAGVLSASSAATGGWPSACFLGPKAALC